MVLLNDVSNRLTLEDSEERRVFSQVSWQQYEALLADLGEESPYRVHFLAGDLEIVAPSRRHESGKTRIGDLLLIYFLETNTEYLLPYGVGRPPCVDRSGRRGANLTRATASG